MKMLYVTDLDGMILANPQSKREIEISVFGEELQYIRQTLANNRIPGFATAYLDEIDELKSIATETIGDNNSDGVTKWFTRRMAKLLPIF